MRSQHIRGFTLIELVIGLVIAGVLASVAIWRIDATLPGWRARQAARWVLTKTRDAAAIAARANVPMELRVDTAAAAACNPQITLQSAPGTGTPLVYDRLCLNEYRGVELGTGTTPSGIRCALEQAASVPALPNCSMCSGSPDAATLTNIVRVLPSGEVATAPGSTGATIAFTATARPTPDNTVAVGIRNVSGRAQVYRPKPDSSGWECK